MEKSLTEKLAARPLPTEDKLSAEELELKRKGNKRHAKSKIASLTRRGRYKTLTKMANRKSRKRRRKALKLNLNRNHPDRKMRDKVRDEKRKAKGLKPIK